MAHDGPGQHYLPSPAVVALKNEAGVGPETSRHAMERSFSQDIQEGSQELKEAAEQTRNIILDLSLDAIIRWVSPSWADVVGTKLEAVKGHPISSFLHDNADVFGPAIAALKSNDSKSQFVKFSVKVPPASDLQHMLPDDDDEAAESILELEGQGIMVYERASGGESHTMWMLQPTTEPVQITIALPQTLVDSLGIGAEVLAKYLTELADVGASDPGNHPPPLPILCRVCERSIVPWWFEKHSDLCVQEHKAELDVQLVQENLSEHRHAIVRVLDALEARKGRPGSGESSPAVGPLPEYKGMVIGPASSTPSSTLSSTPASHSASPNRSRSPSALGIGHARARSFAVRRPLARILEVILDLCDTALDISVPSYKEVKGESDEDFRTQSPQSESRISQINQWQQPSSLENEPGLAALSLDTEALARVKVEAVNRQQGIIEYAERVRQECMAEVDACITEALVKAERAAAGEALSSSESEVDLDDIAEEQYSEEPTPLAVEPVETRTSYVGLKSMASVLRNPLDLGSSSLEGARRSSSQAVSSRSSSPMECPTPKSHRSGMLAQPQPITNRRSLYIESDANDSDGSLSSSILSGNWRSESPASEAALSRTTSSRDRKRRSMHLHGLGTGSPRRQSPGRYPPPPPSPLRMTKPRYPSGRDYAITRGLSVIDHWRVHAGSRTTSSSQTSVLDALIRSASSRVSTSQLSQPTSTTSAAPINKRLRDH